MAMIDMTVETAKVNRLGITPKINARRAAAPPTWTSENTRRSAWGLEYSSINSRVTTHDHEDGSNLGQIAVEALASELVGLVGDDVVGPSRIRRCQHEGLLASITDPPRHRLTE